jgi:hypothetical protein
MEKYKTEGWRLWKIIYCRQEDREMLSFSSLDTGSTKGKIFSLGNYGIA